MTSAPTSFIDRYSDLGLTGGAMDSASIARLEEHLGLLIPAAYRGYLAIAGASPPPKLVGSDCHADYLFKLHEWALELLNESGNPFSLPDDAIVFLMHKAISSSTFTPMESLTILRYTTILRIVQKSNALTNDSRTGLPQSHSRNRRTIACTGAAVASQF